MAWARFVAPFEHDRRPNQAVCFVVKPGVHNLPRDVVDAAVKAGKAVATAPPRRTPNKTEKNTGRLSGLSFT